VKHPVTEDTYLVTGGADWAGGYDGWAGPESILLCGKAKQGRTFGESDSQLQVYLAICRHALQTSKKTIPTIQGFRTNGRQYQFQHLAPDGTLFASKIYDTADSKDLDTVYNFLIQQIQVAIQLSPTTTPVKGLAEDKKKAVKSAESFWGIIDPPPPPSPNDDPPVDPPMEFDEHLALRRAQKDPDPRR
jgi:hypothetical protein